MAMGNGEAVEQVTLMSFDAEVPPNLGEVPCESVLDVGSGGSCPLGCAIVDIINLASRMLIPSIPSPLPLRSGFNE
jgi:hypothetical protein